MKIDASKGIEKADVCPKCGGSMKKNLMLQALGGLKGFGAPVNVMDLKFGRVGNLEGSLNAAVCTECGYTELYLGKKKI